MASHTQLIERFVAALNEHGLEPLFGDQVPPELRGKELAQIGRMYEWRIRSAKENPWVPALEQRLPFRFPRLYHGLIAGYRFAEFEIGPVMFLANTGTSVFNELADVMFRDRHLSPTLMQNGLLQFGKQAGGGYDPICFDMARRVKGDAPVVQIDHEEVLIRSRIRVLAAIAPTFEKLMEDVIAGRHSTR
jgi:hypothetical protein